MYSYLTAITTPARVEVPLFSQSIRAGFPSPAADFVEGSLDFNELLVREAATTFVVRADGESMLGAGIFPGDFLVVDRYLTPRTGDIVIAALDGDFTVKRLRRESGKIILAPENPAFPAITLDAESELSIWGVVTYVLHSLRPAVRR